jgi:hypothetical protein
MGLWLETFSSLDVPHDIHPNIASKFPNVYWTSYFPLGMCWGLVLKC